jgi:hypothetical protein
MRKLPRLSDVGYFPNRPFAIVDGVFSIIIKPHFCIKRWLHPDSELKLYTSPIKIVQETKFVGLLFYSKLSKRRRHNFAIF